MTLLVQIIKLLAVVNVCLFLLPVAAMGLDVKNYNYTNLFEEPQAEIPPDGNVFNRLGKGFSLHKANYFLPGTWGNRASGPEDAELKFQFSFKQHLGKCFYIAYTQKSFWRVLDVNDSRPFRETNYNPELFYRYFFPVHSALRWEGDLGMEHESNGAREPTSRSWNRVYIAPALHYKRLGAKLKIWYRFEEDVKADPNDTTGDENRDIVDFYGYGELDVSYASPGCWKVDLMGRQNFSTGKGAVQLDLGIPTRIQDFYIFLQLWSGYGDSLIDYNHSLTRYGLGFSFYQE